MTSFAAPDASADESAGRRVADPRRPLRAAVALLAAALSVGAAGGAFAAPASIGSSSRNSQQNLAATACTTDASIAQRSGEVDAELVFNGEVVSARAVASFARSGQLLDTADTEGAGLVVPASAELRGNGLMNTISALQNGTVRSAHALGLPWAE